jgi:hypothetical protein
MRRDRCEKGCGVRQMNLFSQLDGCTQVDMMELKPRASDVLHEPTIEPS